MLPKNNIDAFEDTEMLLIGKEDFDNMVAGVPNFRLFLDFRVHNCFKRTSGVINITLNLC